MAPLGNMVADAPQSYAKQVEDIIPDEASAFKDDAYNIRNTRAASLLTFVSGPVLLTLHFIFFL
jgi:hypothetical protein